MTDRKLTDRRLPSSVCGRPRMQSGCTCTGTHHCHHPVHPHPEATHGASCPMKRPETPCKNPRPSAACRTANEELRKIEFALTETTLYLDSHPESDCALAFYHHLIEERNALRRKIADECCPLTIYENTSKSSWDWVDDPWPWHPDAN